MKKLLALLLALVMCLSLAACGDKPSGGNGEKPSNGTSGGDIITQDDLDDLDDALDKLEALKPEGWDENNFGMYIYDIWDEDFLPDILPGPVDGVKPSQTNFKDYKHDVLNSNYSVGAVEYESYEDYHEYSVSFYATLDQLDAYIGELRSAGFTGGEFSSSDSEWREFYFSHPDGWFLYIFFNTNDDDGGNFDGCASVSFTDDLHDIPASIAGVKLPAVGAASYDYAAESWYEIYDMASGDMDTLEVDWNGSFPDKEKYSWWIFFNYYGVDAQQVFDYRDSLVSDGWELQSSDDDTSDGYTSSTLYKDEVYMVVKWNSRSVLEVGFSDMIENISY